MQEEDREEGRQNSPEEFLIPDSEGAVVLDF
jgi:hypothetical protein